MAKIVVSACLLGLPCRYNGSSGKIDAICALAKEHTIIAVCPEQMGGLPTPRPPSEITGERVTTRHGDDVTEEYRRGAEMAVQLAELNQADLAILKARSPSCGKGVVYDGTFTGRKCTGNGITAGLFLEKGIPVYTEEELNQLPL